MEILNFIFASFWHFIGVWVLLAVAGNIFVRTIAVLRGTPIHDCNCDKSDD
jgi:uncharacterized membrane protein YdfJ with MMPL/SSD domain